MLILFIFCVYDILPKRFLGVLVPVNSNSVNWIVPVMSNAYLNLLT